MLLGLRRRADGVDGRIYDAGQIRPLHIQPHLSGNDPAHIEQVLDELGLRSCISLDGVQPLFQVGLIRIHPEQLRPTKNCVQRRAQLVAECREKLVL